MTRPDTITLAGVELSRVRSTRYAAHVGDCVEIVADHYGGWTAHVRVDSPRVDATVYIDGDEIGGEFATPEELDVAVRAALAETFRALLPLVPAEVEAIRAEERERCAAPCGADSEEIEARIALCDAALRWHRATDKRRGDSGVERVDALYYAGKLRPIVEKRSRKP